MPVVLYSAPGSAPCSFVRSVAKLIGVELELKNIDYVKKEHLTPEFQKINFFQMVPVIDDAGFIVYESIAIAYYLLRMYAPNSELYPDCVKHRTRIDQTLAILSSTVHRQKTTFFLPRFMEKKKPSKEEVAAFEEKVLKGFEHLIGDGKYAVGSRLTLADLYLVANIAGVLETGCFENSKYQKLVNYYERMKSELPFFEETCGSLVENIKHCWSELK